MSDHQPPECDDAYPRHDGVDDASQSHRIEWNASLTYGGDLWADDCPYCGCATLFNISYSEYAQVVTTGETRDGDDGDQTLCEPDDRGADRLLRVSCNECGAVLLDRDNPGNVGPR